MHKFATKEQKPSVRGSAHRKREEPITPVAQVRNDSILNDFICFLRVHLSFIRGASGAG
jgi:hypothetical protein